MNNTCSLAFFSLAALACLLPVSANAQTYYQSLPFLPVESQAVVGAPLTFSQANTYSQPLTFSQANMYSPQNVYSHANMYAQPLTFSQANSYSPGKAYLEPNIVFVEQQSSSIYSSIPANTVELATPQLVATPELVATPQVPAFAAPIESHSPAQHQAAACST